MLRGGRDMFVAGADGQLSNYAIHEELAEEMFYSGLGFSAELN